MIWDPEAMETIGSFSIDGVDREGLSPGSNNILRDGDRLVLTLRYFREDNSAETITVAAFIDTTNDTVSYDEETRCGNIAGGIRGGDGNLYFASHTSQAARILAGEAGENASPPCLLRIESGASEFDPEFFVDLNALTDDSPTGFLIPGAENTAFVLAYDDEVVPFEDQPSQVLTQLPAWRFWSIDLGAEITSATQVAGFPPGAAFGFGGVVEVDDRTIPYIINVGTASRPARSTT